MLSVEGVDLGVDGGVFVGDDTVADACVGEGHLHRAVPEESGDRFEAHAPVDRLRGQGVTKAVRMDVADPGSPSDAAHDAVHEVAVEGATVVGDEATVGSDVVDVGGGPVGEQGDEVGVQRDVAVVAQLADRDAQPVAVTDEHDCVGVEIAQLTRTHPGAGEDFDDEPVAGIAGGTGGGHQSGGVTVVEELRERFGAGWDVATDDRVAGRGLGPVPLDDPFEEHPQHPQSLTLRARRQPVAAHPGPGDEPQLEVLDVGPADRQRRCARRFVRAASGRTGGAPRRPPQHFAGRRTWTPGTGNGPACHPSAGTGQRSAPTPTPTSSRWAGVRGRRSLSGRQLLGGEHLGHRCLVGVDQR